MPETSTDRTPQPPIDAASLKTALGAHARRFMLDLRPSCASSNTLLLEAAEQGAAHCTVLVCAEQTGGRGRRGRVWHSVSGGSLTFSLLWRFMPGSPPPMGLSLAVGVAVAQALEALGARGVALKWPNDLLLDGAKLGGILVELVPGAGAIPGAVIGIGLNLHLPAGFGAAADYPVADLAAAFPALPAPDVLLARILIELYEVLTRFTALGFAAARDAWIARNAFQGAQVHLQAEHQSWQGKCLGVDSDGALLLQTTEGVQRVLSGDVSLR